MLRTTSASYFLRRTSVARVSMMFKQLEMTQPLTVKDKPVQSFRDEFGKPPVSKEMENKFGRYAKYSDPSLCTVDTSSEVVLNTYPEGTSQGLIEATLTDGTTRESWNCNMWDEEFFRKNILKPKQTEDGEERTRVMDYTLNAALAGLAIYMVRYALLPLYYVGRPTMSMVGQMNVEAEIGELDLKECKTVVWRGKPIMVYHRNESQMKDLAATPMSALKHPETDEERFASGGLDSMKDHAVVIAICTHLGCIPIPNEGLFNGFFCPCHGSHYDASGRIRQGPAPLNLEVPPFRWIDNQTVYLGN